MRLQKLSKAQIKESLEQTPASVILTGKRKLTKKQTKFCEGVVDGLSLTDAMAQAYDYKGKRKTMSDDASRLAKDPRITAEIEALERAKQFETMYSLAQLRTLVISQLTKEAVDPKSKASERIQALSKLGQVAELGVFVQRTETKVIKDSDTAKNELMEQLKQALADEARTIDGDVDELLSQLTAPAIDNGDSETPPEGDPHFAEKLGSLHLHSTPHTQSANNLETHTQSPIESERPNDE